jgi:A/G-specific adenine glycosylase
MRAALLAWFAAEARPLPWRAGGHGSVRDGPVRDGTTGDDDPLGAALARDRPYALWLVETMSQQTRIETVAARLPAFLRRFPDLATLAAADLDAVLAAWAGLGYYRRARALHAAARVVAEELGGDWPTTVDGWAALPGVGPYTAAAVAAQALGVPGIALDGNVRRVGARLLADPRPSDRRLVAALEARLLAGAESDPAAAAVAEALVELGATVCTPRAPRCSVCPLVAACAGAATGAPAAFPAPRARGAPRRTELHAWIVHRRHPGAEAELALERRPDEGLWGGLHGFPWRESRHRAGPASVASSTA